MKKLSARHWLELAAALLAGSIFLVLLFLILRNPQEFPDWLLLHMPESLFPRILIVLTLFALQGVIPFLMYHTVVLLSSMLFPFRLALAVDTFGTMLCMIPPYLAGRYLRIPYLERRVEENQTLQRFRSHHTGSRFLLSYLLRTFGVSNSMCSFFLGSLKMPMWDYLLSGLLGILPGMLCSSILGSVKSFRSPAFWITLGCNVLIFLTALLYFRRKGRRNTHEEKETQPGTAQGSVES